MEGKPWRAWPPFVAAVAISLITSDVQGLKLDLCFEQMVGGGEIRAVQVPGRVCWDPLNDESNMNETVWLSGGGLDAAQLAYDGGIDFNNYTSQYHLTRASREIWGGIDQYTKVKVNLSDPYISQTYAGALDAVTRRQIDVFLNLVAICCKRHNAMKYSMPLLPRHFYIAFAQPNQVTDIFWIQLKRESWIGVILAIFAFQGATFVTWFSLNSLQRSGDTSKSGSSSYLDFLWWPITALAQKTHEPEPKNHIQRVIFLTGCCFFLILFNYFAANIISTLQMARSIQTVTELLQHDEMVVALPQLGPWLTALQHSTGTEVSEMITRLDSGDRRVLLDDSSEPGEDAMTRGWRSNKAYVLTDNFLFNPQTKLMQDGKARCGLTYFKLPSTETKMTYAMNLRFPHKVVREVDRGLLRMWETGITKHVELWYKPRPPPCADNSNSAYKPASLQHVYSAFMVYGIGCAVAVFIAVTECLCFKTMKSCSHVLFEFHKIDRM